MLTESSLQVGSKELERNEFTAHGLRCNAMITRGGQILNNCMSSGKNQRARQEPMGNLPTRVPLDESSAYHKRSQPGSAEGAGGETAIQLISDV